MSDSPKLPKGWHEGQWSALSADCSQIPQNRPVECGDCNWTGDEGDIDVMIYDCSNLFERLDAGSVVPVGECPAQVMDSKDGVSVCGAFVYYTDVEIAYRRTPGVLDQIVEACE